MGPSAGHTGWTGCFPRWAVSERRRCWCEPGSYCAQQLQVLFHALAPAQPLELSGHCGGAGPSCLTAVQSFVSFVISSQRARGGGKGGKTVIICLSGSILCTLRRNSEISADTGLFPFVWVSFDSFQGVSFLPAPSGVLLQEISVCPDGKVKGEQVWRGKEAKQAL